MKTTQQKQSTRAEGELAIFILIVAGIAIVVPLLLLVWPQYRIYSSRAAGQAMLAHAQSAKEVAVAEAKAKMESAELLAQAEVLRAHGVAKANQIIGESLKGNEAYLKYLWINDIGQNTGRTVIYVPTEANLPVLEAGRGIK